MDAGNSRRGSSGCGGCLCFAFVLMLFATASPYWIWRSSWYVNGVKSTVASGSYVASSISGTVYSWPYNYYVSSQYNNYDVFVNDPFHTLCLTNVTSRGQTVNYYEAIGQYGWCDQGVSGPVNQPGPVSTIQALSITCTITLFLASILAFVAPNAGGSKVGFSAASMAFVSMCLSCAAFSVAASYSWYSHMLAGGRLPVYSNGQVELSDIYKLYWGPAFWSVVTVFIISLFASFSMCAMSKKLDDDLDGTYGSGGDAEDPIGDYGGQAGDYAYGVEKA